MEHVKKNIGKSANIRSVVLFCIALSFMTLSVYMQTRHHPFSTLDDIVYVTNNPHVASGMTGSNIIWAFTSVDAANWHPITWLSHMTDVQLYGMNPGGHHLTNVVIHVASSLFLLIFLFRSTGSLWRSSFVAALFALHPLHVESVAWVAERKDVLSAFFGFLTLLMYSEYVAKQKPLLYLLCLFCFVLGLMSKPMLVTLPIVMLLMDFWPLGRCQHGAQGSGTRQLSAKIIGLIQEKAPFFACALFSCIITFYAQSKGGATSGFGEIPPALRIENALVAYVKYIIKTLWPRDIAVIYPFPLSIPLWQVIGSLLVILLISAAVIRSGRRYPYLPMGWFWFLVTLVPVIGLIQVGEQSMADRYSYIPLTGLFIVAAWGVPDLAAGMKHRDAILALFAGTIIIASAILTWRQLGYWQDPVSLFRHANQVTPDSYVIHKHLGVALGDIDDAIKEYQEAIRLKPDYADAHNNLGVVLAEKGNLDAAIDEYRKTLRINPNFPLVHMNLGIVLANKGNLDEAIQEFQEALRIEPNDIEAHNSLGIALAKKGNLDAAIKEFQFALRRAPGYSNAQMNLRTALEQKKLQSGY